MISYGGSEKSDPLFMKAIFFNEPAEANFLGHQLGEVYKEEVYKPFLLGKSDLTILDIGGNIGVTSFYFSHFAKRVITVEPSKEHFEVLKKMVEFNELKNVTLVNKAIFMQTGKYPLFHNQNKTMFSLHMAVNDGSQKEELVDTITLEDLFKQEKIDHVDLMKLDIEGSEIEVLSHSSFKAVADKIDLIITERHQWSGRHPNQLNEALKNTGFTVEQIPSNADLVVAKRI
jgi:FkbM family methyltransferase